MVPKSVERIRFTVLRERRSEHPKKTKRIMNMGWRGPGRCGWVVIALWAHNFFLSLRCREQDERREWRAGRQPKPYGTPISHGEGTEHGARSVGKVVSGVCKETDRFLLLGLGVNLFFFSPVWHIWKKHFGGAVRVICYLSLEWF